MRLMLDLHDGFIEQAQLNDQFNDHGVPRFEDIHDVFILLTENILEARQLLQIRPVHKKQQENFDRVLKCVTHLIYLMVKCAKEEHEKRMVRRIIF